MGPRFLQSQIHSDYSIDSAIWASYKTGIESMYESASSKADFDNHLIREYNRKIDALNQPSVLFMSPYDAGFRYAPYSEIISAILGGDDPANALEPNATAHLLIDGPLYNTLGDPDSGFVGDQSWRSLAPAAEVNGKTSYASGDEQVRWDGTQWLYVNIYNDGGWSQLGADVDGEASGDLSGHSVSINAAGDRMVIGAPYNNGTSGTDRGSVRVYELTNGSWTQLGGDIDGEASGDQSGYSVSINDVGDRVAIGAYLNDNANGTNSGHVRVYQLINNIWQQLGADINGEAANDFSGLSVSMNAAGNRVAIGAPYNNSTISFYDNGHVRIYEWDGLSWNKLGDDINGQPAILGESSAPWNGANSGWSVSMNAAGDRVVIGAILYGVASGGSTGNVRIFQWSNSSWTLMGTQIQGEADFDEFGWSVSMNSVGNRIAVSSRKNDNNRGYVKIYEWNNTSWVQLGANIIGDAEGDYSGNSVSLNADGNRVAIGAIIYDDGAGSSRPGGYVRVYELINGVWTKLDINIVAESLGDENGYSVSLNAVGDRVAIGAPYNDGINGVDSGSVRVFEYSPPLPFSVSSNDVTYPWLATWTNDFAGAKVTPTYMKINDYPAVP